MILPRLRREKDIKSYPDFVMFAISVIYGIWDTESSPGREIYCRIPLVWTLNLNLAHPGSWSNINFDSGYFFQLLETSFYAHNSLVSYLQPQSKFKNE